MSVKLFAYVLVGLAIAGCGDKLQPLPPGTGSDFAMMGGNDDSGAPADLGMAVIDMTGFNQAGSPVITITAPAAGAEVSGDKMTVTATVTSPSNTLIPSGAVQVTITPPGGAVISAVMTLTATANVYSGDIGIDKVPSGPAAFTVVASDITGLKSSAVGTYVHDHGPVLTFVRPTATSAKDKLAVEIIVDDALHPITMLSQVKAGIRTANDITLTQIAGAVPFRVAANVDLTKYSPTLDGEQLLSAQATNSKGTVGSASKKFIVDNTGPVISITEPVAGTFHGGVIEITADITDISGVDENTVLAVFGGNASYSVKLTRLQSNTFHGFFDVRSLGTSFVLPGLSVRADDTLGNHGEIGEEIIVDNTKPWMTMDTKIPLRISRPNAQIGAECSALFDPLGSDAAFDGQTVQQIVTLRTRIEDHGNWAPGLVVERFSGIVASSVTMYAVPDDGTPVAVDTDGDNICDDVNPLLVPTTQVMMSGEALALAMAQMKANGPADFRFDASKTPTGAGGACTSGPDCPPPGCNGVGNTGITTAPTPLCVTTSQTTTLQYSTPAISSIWTIAPLAECAGLQLDTLNSLPEGPTCVITRATDVAGNTMVSYPLHICIKRSAGACTSFAPVASHCTGKFDKVTQKIVAGTCNPPTEESSANPRPSPGTFSTGGKEVRSTVTGSSFVP